jgi:hypothetical protein
MIAQTMLSLSMTRMRFRSTTDNFLDQHPPLFPVFSQEVRLHLSDGSFMMCARSNSHYRIETAASQALATLGGLSGWVAFRRLFPGFLMHRLGSRKGLKSRIKI